MANDNQIDDWVDVPLTKEEEKAKRKLSSVDEIDDWQDVPVEGQPTQLEAGVRGFGQGATFGFADELIGAGEAAGETLFGEAKLKDLLETYKKRRDESREAFKEAEVVHPKTYLAGELSSALIPGVALTKLGTAGKLGTKILGGKGSMIRKSAALGGITGAGLAEEDVGEGIITGATIGGAFGAGLKTLGKTYRALKAPKELRKKAQITAFSAAGATPKEMGKELTKFKHRAGKEILGEIPDGEGGTKKILELKGGSEGLVVNLQKAMDVNREKIAPLFREVQERINKDFQINPDMAIKSMGEETQNLWRKSSDKYIKKIVKSGEVDPDLGAFVERFSSEHPNIDFDIKGLNEAKIILGKKLSEGDWYNPLTKSEIPGKKDLIQDMYMVTKKRIEDLGDMVSLKGEKLGQDIKEANAQFGGLMRAKTSAFDEYRKRAGKPPATTFLDVAMTTGAIGSLNPIVMAAVVLKKGTEIGYKRRFGQVMQITTAKALNGLATTIERAATKIPDMDTKKVKLLSDGVRKLIAKPLAERGPALAVLLNKDMFQKQFGELQSYAEKETPVEEIEEKDKENNVALKTKALNIAEPESLSALSDKLRKKGHTVYSKQLEGMEDMPKLSRTHRIFNLMQQPAFRELLDEIRREELEEQNKGV